MPAMLPTRYTNITNAVIAGLLLEERVDNLLGGLFLDGQRGRRHFLTDSLLSLKYGTKDG